jgi:hypothetical protein
LVYYFQLDCDSITPVSISNEVSKFRDPARYDKVFRSDEAPEVDIEAVKFTSSIRIQGACVNVLIHPLSNTHLDLETMKSASKKVQIDVTRYRDEEIYCEKRRLHWTEYLWFIQKDFIGFFVNVMENFKKTNGHFTDPRTLIL